MEFMEIGIVQSVQLNDWDSIPGRNFSLCHHILSSCWAHPPSCQVSTEGSFSGTAE